MRSTDDTPRELAELTALADGTLDPARRGAAQARVDASPELAEALAEQRAAVLMLRTAAAEVGAPARLRAKIEAERRSARPAARRWRLQLGSAAAGALAVAVATVALVLPGGTIGAP